MDDAILDKVIHYGAQRFAVCKVQFEAERNAPAERRDYLSRRLSAAYDFLTRAEELKRVEEYFRRLK